MNGVRMDGITGESSSGAAALTVYMAVMTMSPSRGKARAGNQPPAVIA